MLNIFQIFDRKNEVPSIVKENILKLNDNINYQLFDFKDGKEFIKKNFEINISNKLINRIDNLTRYAHKSDLLRYCLLYKLGGIYLDIDLKPLVPFRQIIKNYDFVTQLSDEINNSVVNGFIYTKKNNPWIFAEIKFLMKMGSYSKHNVPCSHFYNNLNSYLDMKTYSELNLGNLKCYFNLEIKKEDEKFYIVDKDNNVLINSNNHNYPSNLNFKKYAFR